MKTVFNCFAVWSVGCGSVNSTPGSAVDAQPFDASLIDAAPVRFGDQFTGATLNSQWDTTSVGSQGAFHLLSPPRLHFDNAGGSTSFATPYTSSRCALTPGNLDAFVGNQIVLPVPVGTHDFDLKFKLGWNEPSSSPDVDQYGVALTDARHRLLAFGFFQDGSSGDVGSPGSAGFSIHAFGSTSDVCALNAASTMGTAVFEFSRHEGRLDVTIDGVAKANPGGEVFTGDVQFVSIVNNGFSVNTPFEFDLYFIDGQYQP